MSAGLTLLKALTDIVSPSGDAAGIAAKGAVCTEHLSALGFAVDSHELGGVPHLVARRPAAGRPRAALVSHLDTVLSDPDWRMEISGDRATGPGVADPLGGVVVMLRALQRLNDAGDLDAASWTVVLNGDEEIGSPHSAALLRDLAKDQDAAFIFESGRATGQLVRQRAGSGHWELRATGVAAHAGVNPQDGANAVVALSHAVVDVAGLSAFDQGVSVNVGTVRGGLKRNQVPDEALAEVDVRFRHATQQAAITSGVADAAARARAAVPGTTVEAVLLRGRPAWPGGPGTAALLRHWQQAATGLGLPPIEAVATGGGSDANILADAGVPCLDGLGAVGGGYHTRQEWILADSVEERAELTAAALRLWAADNHG